MRKLKDEFNEVFIAMDKVWIASDKFWDKVDKEFGSIPVQKIVVRTKYSFWQHLRDKLTRAWWELWV